MNTLNIATDFSEFTGLRHCDISDYSGEEFYHSVLNRAFKEAFEKDETLTVLLDEVDGFASSFLDESFGNLIYDFTEKVVSDNVEIVSEIEPHWKKMLLERTFPEWEERRLNKNQPKVTRSHDKWFRLVEGELISNVWETPVSQ